MTWQTRLSRYQKLWKSSQPFRLWTMVSISLLVSLDLAYLVFRGYWHFWMVIAWLINLIILLGVWITRVEWTEQRKWLVLEGLIIAFIPIIIRLLLYDSGRIHGDDMLTAYFSAHYDIQKDNFFGGVPPIRTDWVSQFPSVYFVLQKIIFSFIGTGVFQTMISTLPYVLVIAICLYVLGTKLLSKLLGVFAVILYALFPPSLYLETIGLHFSMSTAVYCLLLVGLLAYWRTKRAEWAILTGIATGFSLLGYTSSYIAVPMVLSYFLVLFLTESRERLAMFLDGLLVLGCFLIVWLPFGTYLIDNNYLIQRTDQVALLGGEWSQENETRLLSSQAVGALQNVTVNSLRSLVVDNIGGHGGYNFGHQRLLQPIPFLLLIVGLITVGYLSIKKERFWLVILLSILISFGAVIFSIPPPAYHRFSLAFPLLALIMSAAFFPLSHWRLNRYFAGGLLAMGVMSFVITNYLSYKNMVSQELPNDTVTMAHEIQRRCDGKGRKWYVAAFPGFAFDKQLYIIDEPQHRQALTDYHSSLINSFDPTEKYCYVILYPEEFNTKFASLDSHGNILPLSKSYSLFMN